MSVGICKSQESRFGKPKMEISEILQECKKYGIVKIDLTDIDSLCDQLKMARREKILQRHYEKFNISQVKNGRWRSFLPNEEGKKGKEVKRSTKEAVEDAIVEFYLALDKSKLPTFLDCYEEWREYHHDISDSTGNTIYKYNTDYERFLKGTDFEQTPIRDLTDVDVEKFFLDTIKNYVGRKGESRLTYKSFTRLYEYVEGTFKRAYRRKIISTNPMDYLTKKEFRNVCREETPKTAETETVNDEMFNEILGQLYRDMQDNPTYLAPYAVELGALTGMRVAEIATLKWQDVDLEHGIITIERSDKYNRLTKEWKVEGTKTKMQRQFPIDDHIRRSIERIRRIQKEYNMESEWLFPHPEYIWLRSNIISSCMKNKCRQLGFHRTYGIHAFRKTLNSDMRHDGATSILCSGMMGNTPEVNNKYYTYDTSNMDEKREYVQKVHARRSFS